MKTTAWTIKEIFNLYIEWREGYDNFVSKFKPTNNLNFCLIAFPPIGIEPNQMIAVPRAGGVCIELSPIPLNKINEATFKSLFKHGTLKEINDHKINNEVNLDNRGEINDFIYEHGDEKINYMNFYFFIGHRSGYAAIQLK